MIFGQINTQILSETIICCSKLYQICKYQKKFQAIIVIFFYLNLYYHLPGKEAYNSKLSSEIQHPKKSYQY